MIVVLKKVMAKEKIIAIVRGKKRATRIQKKKRESELA